MNNGLKRAELEKLTQEFVDSIKDYEIFKIPNNLYLDYFDKIEKSFNEHVFDNDKRFVTYGRLDFLRNELTQRLDDVSLKTESANWKDKWDNRLGAFWDLSDYIRGDRHISPHQVPEGMSFKDVLLANDQYYKDGYICKEEKEILLDMINEMRNHINNSLEEKDMGLFSKKDKYDVKPEDNVPQFVYGIPDFMKEEYKKEADKKYDVKPEDNVPYEVYGIPDFKKKEFENRDIPSSDFDKVQEKYDVKPENNVPQRVYGIPNPDLYNKKKKVFEAFVGGYSGPSSFYYIFKEGDSYIAKYGYSQSGMKLFEDSPELKAYSKTNDEYQKLLLTIRPMVSQWQDTYHNNDIMDGTQWNIDLLEMNKKFYGSNEYPSNFGDVFKVINEFFNVKNEKYDINPEDNVPQMVYGTPDFMKEQTKQTYDNMSIRFRLDNGNKRFVMLFKNDKFSSFIIFANQDKLNETAMADAETVIPKKEYERFCDRLAEIIKDWDERYEGDKNINWDIKFTMEKEGSEVLSGKGAVPSNWNELVDLLSEYEILFKKKKKIDKETKKISNDSNKTFEEIVREDNVDQFWADTIINYFKNELKESDVAAKIIYKDLTKYNDIFNEFTKYLVQKSYDIPNAISIEGYTAKQIHELNPDFTATGVYTFLKFLKDKPEEAKDIIKKGFPNKDVIPPIIAKTNSDLNDEEAEKRLKEIEEEVDQEMIKQGLLRIEDGKKIPSFGSCHVRWGIEKKILKERFGIDWKTPAEKNPNINFD